MGGTVCRICLEVAPDVGHYHRSCLRTLLGRDEMPTVPASLQEMKQNLHELLVAETEQKMSISGVQPKALVRINEHDAFEIVGAGSTHILKPPVDRLPHIAPNEHVSMRLAARLGLTVPPCGLLRVGVDDVYIVRRFDRNGRKRNTNDFCQLLEVAPEQKYDATSEQCAEVVARCCDEPVPSFEVLFRTLFVGYVLHNGDVHLKNLSLIEDDEGHWAMSPTYDMVNTHFYERDRWTWILPVDGERKNVTRKQWIILGEQHCHLSSAHAGQIIDDVLAGLDEAKEIISRGFLPTEWKREYGKLLDKRKRGLKADPRKRSR